MATLAGKDLQMRNFSLKFEIRICCNVSYPGKRNILSLMYSGKSVAGLPTRPTRYRPYAGLLMRNMQGSYVANNTFHALDQGIQYYQLNNTGVFNTDINENTFNNCGVGLTIAPLQNPYNLSLPLNPYGVLQQVTFNCNHFNNGNIGFIGCGEVPVHGNISNGIGNEFNNLNIANGIWGGLDTLEYFYSGTIENPRLTSQPTQMVLCNGKMISSWPENDIDNISAGASQCGLSPSLLTNNKQPPSENRDYLLIYPNPTFDGLVNVRHSTSGVLNYRIASTNGITLSEGQLGPSTTEIMLPSKVGMCFMHFYASGVVVARFKVIRL